MEKYLIGLTTYKAESFEDAIIKHLEKMGGEMCKVDYAKPRPCFVRWMADQSEDWSPFGSTEGDVVREYRIIYSDGWFTSTLFETTQD